MNDETGDEENELGLRWDDIGERRRTSEGIIIHR